MTIAITAFITGLVYFVINLFIGKKRDDAIEHEKNEGDLKNGLLKLAVKRNEIKREIDAKSLAELVDRKRDGDNS